MRTGTRRPLSAAAIAALAVIFLSAFPRGAVAEDVKVGCAELVAKARASGVAGTAVVDKEWGLARLSISGMFCTEPVEEWRPRHLGWPTESGSLYTPPANLAEPKPAPKSAEVKPVSAKPTPPKPEPAAPMPAKAVSPKADMLKAEAANPAATEAAPPAQPAAPRAPAPADHGARSFTVDTSKSMLKRAEPAPAITGAPESPHAPEPVAEVPRIYITPDLAAEHRDVAAGKATLAPAGVSGAVEEKKVNTNWILWAGIGLVVVLALVAAGLIFLRLRQHRADETDHAEHDEEEEEA